MEHRMESQHTRVRYGRAAKHVGSSFVPSQEQRFEDLRRNCTHGIPRMQNLRGELVRPAQPHTNPLLSNEITLNRGVVSL